MNTASFAKMDTSITVTPPSVVRPADYGAGSGLPVSVAVGDMSIITIVLSVSATRMRSAT